jgi:hypothetical protein
MTSAATAHADSIAERCLRIASALDEIEALGRTAHGRRDAVRAAKIAVLAELGPALAEQDHLPSVMAGAGGNNESCVAEAVLPDPAPGHLAARAPITTYSSGPSRATCSASRSALRVEIAARTSTIASAVMEGRRRTVMSYPSPRFDRVTAFCGRPFFAAARA